MINKMIKNIKNIETNILKIMLIGFNFSYIVFILSCLTLLMYIINPVSYIIYECGLSLLKAGIIFICTLIICGTITNNIKNGLI